MKAITRRSYSSFAKETCGNPKLCRAVLKEIGKKLRKERQILYHDQTQSILKDTNLQTFNWASVIEELKTHAPTLLNILSSCMHGTNTQTQKRVIGICTAILCKHRRASMSTVQKIISIILATGHAS